MLTTLELNPSNEAVRSIIWLHGLGANADDFAPIVPQLNIKDPYQLRFVFPNAPLQPVTINGGVVMPAWYDIYEVSVNARIDRDGIKRSQAAIIELIKQEEARGIQSDHIMLAGFSQGAVIALITGLQYDKPLAGIIGLSGYLPEAEINLKQISLANKTCPVFLAHGTADPIVPYPLGLECCEQLLRANLPLSWHSYYMPHSVCIEEIQDLSKWLKNTFDKKII